MIRWIFTSILAIAALHGQLYAETQLPAGKWNGREQNSETCLEVLSENKLRLTFQGPQDRNPIVIDGNYQITATGSESYKVEFTVATIKTKTISKCRKYWIDLQLESTRQLGIEIRPGQKLQLTLHFQCTAAQNTVQLCLSADTTVCRTLHSAAVSRCDAQPQPTPPKPAKT